MLSRIKRETHSPIFDAGCWIAAAGFVLTAAGAAAAWWLQ
jgi:hypothetical protein